jgi:hypothetical protein
MSHFAAYPRVTYPMLDVAERGWIQNHRAY